MRACLGRQICHTDCAPVEPSDGAGTPRLVSHVLRLAERGLAWACLLLLQAGPGAPISPSRLFHFSAGATGPWRIARIHAARGAPLPGAERLAIANALPPGSGLQWTLRGITSNERYVERAERQQLVAAQEGLGRPAASHAALIPIRKSSAWWQLTQDERRTIFEQRSRHTAIGLRYLPAVARRLHHCRDLGEHEPFDFLTWFEFAPADAARFDELLAALRATPEWEFVEREVEVRLERAPIAGSERPR